MHNTFSKNPHIIIMEHSLNRRILSSDNGKNAFSYNQNNLFHLGITESESKLTNESQKDDLFLDLRGFLIFGRIIGLLPFSGVFGKSSEGLSYRRKSLPSIISCAILLILLLNASLGVIMSIKAPKRNALEIASSVRATLYFIWGCFLYLTFLFRGEEFLNIFHAWRKTIIVYSEKDKTLKRDVILISGTILTSAILENAVLHLEYINKLDSISGAKFGNSTEPMSILQSYYWRSHAHWATVLGYNWFFAVLSFIQHKWLLYSWNYIDILIAVFGRAMYFKFKMVYKVAREKLLQPKETVQTIQQAISQDSSAWTQVIRDHKNLCTLLDRLEHFFSPLVFGSYAINMYYVCLQLLDGLTSEVNTKSIVHSIYAPWSFLHLVLRIYVVSICCARINVYAHQIRNIFQECPPECYTPEVSRVDKRVTSGPHIGLSGCGCFTVTLPFILSILSVVFTFEIVLLQCVPTTAPQPTDCCCPTTASSIK